MESTGLGPLIRVTITEAYVAQQGAGRTTNDMEVKACGDSRVGENTVSIVVEDDDTAGCTDYGIGRSGNSDE
jgi:hypothetical protein